ncbi:MAG: exonuclease domain-containing protein [Steroidobacteraceae bacterium]
MRCPVACIDLETTGGTAIHHRVIEVGIVLLDGGEVVEEWSSLVNPGVRIPSSIESFTGISNQMVEDAPSFEDIRTEVRRRLDGRLFVAHNAPFDYGFVRNELRRTGEKFSAPVLCTVRLSRALFREHARHNLDTLIERWNLTCGARHRALGDAAVLPPLLAAFEGAVGPERLQEATEAARYESRLPGQLSPDLADDLPDGPGVYLFRGEGGALLYVGKSRSLRSRVLAHFAAEHRSSKESKLARQVRDIEWLETGGELGALLLESRLVKELAPAANRRLRKPAGAHCLRLRTVDAGLVAAIEPFDAEDFDADVESFGPFRTERDAVRALEGKAREAGLCLKVLGLEQGEGSCFAYQLGKCRGACVGREPRPLHDTRLRLALASLRVRPWPFGGPVGIREAEAGGAGTVLHVIDRWQHVGTARDDDEVAAILGSEPRGPFDPDAYRIVARCLEKIAPRDLVVFERRGR